MTGEFRGRHEAPAPPQPQGSHAAHDPARARTRGMRLHWVFHFIVLPLVFTASVILIVGLASVYLSPGGYHDGNALDALRSSIPVALGVLLALALLAVLSFAGLYGMRKWSLVTLIVLLVILIACGIAAGWAAWSYLAAHGALAAQVDARFAAALGHVRAGGPVLAVVSLLFLVYYARRAPMFVTAAELREQRRLVSYEQW